PAFDGTVTTSAKGPSSVSTAPSARSGPEPHAAATATTATSTAAAANILTRGRAPGGSDGGDDGDRVGLLAAARSEDPLARGQLDLRRPRADERARGDVHGRVPQLLQHEPARRALVGDGDRVATGVQPFDALPLEG